MPRYRVLRDFGSHLGNHYRGEWLNLPDGPLPRGFAGFVERVAETSTKDVRPAADVPAAAEPSESAVPPHRSEPEASPTPTPPAEIGYDDKAIRPRRRP